MKDVSGLTPMDIAQELLGGYEVLRPTLTLVADMLKTPSIFAEFAMLKTPSKPLTKNNKIVSLFLLLISLTFGLSTVMMN